MSTDEYQDYIDSFLGRERRCPHAWRHTVYGSDDPTRNGTTCVLCGERL